MKFIGRGVTPTHPRFADEICNLLTTIYFAEEIS